MLPYFQKRAKEEGFEGLAIIAQAMFNKENNELEALIDYKIQYEPNYSRFHAWENKVETMMVCPGFLLDLFLYRIKAALKKITNGKFFNYMTYNYDTIWTYILKRHDAKSKFIAGAFVKCDVLLRS